MKTLLASLLLLAVGGSANAGGPVTVAFRLASPEPVPGWEAVPMEGSDRTWCLAPEVLLDQSAFAVATAMPGDGDSWIVDILMTEAGRAQLAALTRAHEGERLGMVVDGRLVTAPVIRAPITEGRALLTGHFTPQEARRIAAGVVAGRGE